MMQAMWTCLSMVLLILQVNASPLDEEPSFVQSVNKKFQQLENEIQGLRSENSLLKEEMNTLKDTVQKSRADRVAFTVYQSGDTQVAGSQPVKFNTVITNEGGGWSTENGQFTCPVSGLYFFSVTSFSFSHHVTLQIVKGSTYLPAAFTDNSNWDQGSNTVLVACAMNEIVYVRNSNDDDGELNCAWHDGDILNSFSGFLVSI